MHLLIAGAASRPPGLAPDSPRLRHRKTPAAEAPAAFFPALVLFWVMSTFWLGAAMSSCAALAVPGLKAAVSGTENTGMAGRSAMMFLAADLRRALIFDSQPSAAASIRPMSFSACPQDSSAVAEKRVTHQSRA